VLARRFDGPIVAVDAHRPFLDELRAELAGDASAGRVETLHADFAALDEDFGKYDLLWAEAAACVMGFERALIAWWPLLSGGGRAAISELCYLVDQPSDEVKAYVSSIHPTVTTVVSNTAAAERNGYTVVDTLVLSNRDYRAYYNPLKARLAELRAAGEMSAELTVVAAELETEMRLHERHGDEFGWVFFLLEKPADAHVDADDGFGDSDAAYLEPELVEGAEESSVRPRKGRGATARAFDAQVAPTNAVTYQKLEQRLVELIRDCGLKRAAHVLSEVEAEVGKAIKRGRSQ
jgi:hypothetical protein